MSYLTKILLLSTMAIFLISVAGIVEAQETSSADVAEIVALDEDVQPEDLGVSEPTILPDSPFYFLKNWRRGIQTFFVFNPIAKTELKQRFANERLIELKKMVEEGKKTEAIEGATEDYQKEVKKIKEAAEKIKEKAQDNSKVDKFLDKFIEQQILHERILQKLETQVATSTFEKIKEAREEHLERFGEVMTKLEDRKEKITEKLEEKMEEMKGSEFKEFKNLEVLKELEEKVPEEAREAIQKARENIAKRLEENLGQSSTSTQEKFQEYTEKISGAKEKHIEILEEIREGLENNPDIQKNLIKARDRIRAKIKQGALKELNEIKKPSACAEIWEPVCGKDGKTYSNACSAKLEEVEIDYEGECKK